MTVVASFFEGLLRMLRFDSSDRLIYHRLTRCPRLLTSGSHPILWHLPSVENRRKCPDGDMRYLFAKAIISLLAFAYASADDVRVYMFDSEPLSPQPRNYEVSPGAARLLLSRRLTPSDTSLLGQVDEKLVKCMNEFGGQQSALLSTLDTIDDVSRLLVVWEGAEAYSGMS